MPSKHLLRPNRDSILARSFFVISQFIIERKQFEIGLIEIVEEVINFALKTFGRGRVS